MKKTLVIALILLFINIYAYGSTGYTNMSNIPLYATDNLGSDIRDTLKMNTKVEILDNKGEWLSVKTDSGKSGWIERPFITIPPEKYVVNNTSYNINIRTSPTTGSKLVGQLLPEAGAKYIDTYHSWHIIEYKGSQYYIASWLTDIEYKAGQKIYLLYDKINLRKSPSLTSQVLGQGNRNDSYELVGEENGWFKIRLDDKSYAYVAGWLTTYDSYSYPEDQQAYKKTSDNLNMRTGPSAEYKKITTIKKGDIVKTLDSKDGWDKVISKEGYVGWCNSYYLQAAKPLAGKIILLDPGHGGHDPGAISFSGKFEKNINLDVAATLKEILNSLGATVHMTRTKDVYIANKERGKAADKLGADILLSIHHNSLNNSNYFGLSTYYNTIKYKDKAYGYDLAEAVYLHAVTINGVYRDGILDRNYEVLRETNTPAALIEIGFMSNPTEEMNIHNLSFQSAMAQKIADGIVDYFYK